MIRLLRSAALAAVLAPGALIAASAIAAPPTPTPSSPTPSSPSVEPWPLPAGDVHAAQPSLSAGPDGRVHLSWIERRGGGMHRLRMATAERGTFGAVHTIAEDRGWFVNWADFPSLVALENGDLVSHLLVKTAPMPYAYDLRLLRSRDGGRNWSEPWTVHDDGTHGEHGFAALWPAGGDALGVAWLDGRNTAAGRGTGPSHHGHDGAMSLRAAVVGRDGKHADVGIDDRVCDCCQTDVALTDDGPVLVYRDRGENEIRDISVVRRRDGAWDAPTPVHADRWHMPACPVNGPAVTAHARDVYVAWYTAADGVSRVQLARSRDAGVTFDVPRVVASGGAVLGRVDVQRLGDRVLVSWLEAGADGQRLQVAAYDARTADAADSRSPVSWTVATLSARGHASGFPRMAVADGSAWIAWTDVIDGAPRIRGARMHWPATD